MRIGIDARMFFMSGIGTYLKNLLGGLASIDEDNEYTVFIQKDDIKRFEPPGNNFFLSPVSAPPYSFSEQVGLARRIEGRGLDLIHHPHYAAPMFGRVPMIATIHDLIHQLFPELCPSRLAWRFSWMLARRTARRAKLLLTVSEYTRSDIINHLGVPSGKVRLTYNALPPDWGKSMRPEPPPGMGDETPFFLYVGNHKTHKNIPLLLEAFAGVRERAPAARLALTGEREGLEADMARLRLGDEVVFLGDVSRGRLEGIYTAARALVFPSRYEGFGYPPLEAMGCGTPAIVSDAASLPEVVGEGGLIVPVGEAAPLRDAMMRLLGDDALRVSLSEKARAQAAGFSWRALAEDTLKAYRDVLSPSPASSAAAQGDGA